VQPESNIPTIIKQADAALNHPGDVGGKYVAAALRTNCTKGAEEGTKKNITPEKRLNHETN
jgi:hypothetical protein